MSWLKDVIVDIAVSIFIVSAVLLQDPWMRYVIWAYTGLMLIAKLVVLTGDSFSQIAKKARSDAPDWFSHLLYAVNTIALFVGQWWYAAVAWALIWLFSYLAQRKHGEGKKLG